MTGPVIAAHGLVKTFGGRWGRRTTRALDGLDLTVEPGEVHGFLGPNGAGKSTAIRVLLGLYRRDAGDVRVLGLDPGAEPAAVTRQVAYVPGDVTLWPQLTGQQVLDVLAGLRGRYDAEAERRLVDDLALDPSRRVRTYSKGNRQKVALVAAFAASTPLLILDEPTTGLDPLMEEVFQHCVRAAARGGRTVLLSSHILSEVDQLCDTVTIVKDGRTVESGPLGALRHLASARITARVALTEPLRTGLNGAGAAGRVDDAGMLDVTCPADAVNLCLRLLLDAGAQQVTCTAATMEDLFLRHYEVSAR